MASAGGSNTYKLSSELLPYPEGGGKACCLLPDGKTLVTGGDDRMVTLWEATEHDDTMFASKHVCPEAENSIRDIVALPTTMGGFIEQAGGGFATASLDKCIRIYSLVGECLMTLKGHTGGVISLDVSSDGKLISGSWDGTARIWSVLDAKCVSVLSGHENGVSVAALQSGLVVTGSTGRKNENNQHVDYKLRFWEAAGSPTSSEYNCIKTLEDHNQAVRSVCEVPNIGWASGSNDGTVKLRGQDGSVLKAWENELSSEGTPASVFNVCYLANSHELATCNENSSVTIYDISSLLVKDVIKLPGTPWKVAQTPNGADIVIACDQAGTSRKGHYFIFSNSFERSAEGKSDSRTLQNFEEYCEPPKKQGDDSQASGGGEPNIQSWGHYDSRNQIPGTEDGKYGFFHKDDGSIWACMWSASAGQWMDIGQVTGAPSEGETESADGKQRGPDGKLYDIVRPVEVEGGATPSTLTLAFNFQDDPVQVAQQFCVENNLSMEMYEQVRDFVIQQRLQCGLEGMPVSSGSSSLKQLPMLGYVTFHNFNPTAAVKKILELNSELSSEGSVQSMGAALDDSNVEWKTLRNVVEKTSFYHSSKFPPEAGRILLQLLNWPSKHIAPVLDIVRMLSLHENASLELPKLLNVAEVLHRRISDSDCPGGAKIIAMRTMSNCFSKVNLRRHVGEHADVLVESMKFALSNELSDQFKSKCIAAAASTAINMSIAFHEEELSESSIRGVLGWIRMVGELPISLPEQTITRCVAAVGNIAHKNIDVAKNAGVGSIITSFNSKLPQNASSQVKETFEDIQKLVR
eukprot:gb/GECG01016479.1/.p1 GENE.gb/GECG01016479.1/~~gb/GECG01016479.1/.p1  ORF type:complete len:804 (+),score=107.84 gb/GECG01016479.1/:1-2412(+)